MFPLPLFFLRLPPQGYCSRCKEFRNASKKMDVWRLPPILAIQLKRFQYTQYSRRKLRNNVHVRDRGWGEV